MRFETGSFSEKPYTHPSSIATYIMCGALMLPGGICNLTDVSTLDEQYTEPGICTGLSADTIQGEIYRFPAPTWASVKISQSESVAQISTSQIDVTESLDTINKFSFLAVDENVDSEIEQYFSSKSIKTKTIFTNQRIHKG